jgi:hypothetical protein
MTGWEQGAVLFASLGLSNHDALAAVVDGDPTTDITALLRPIHVVRAGRAAIDEDPPSSRSRQAAS